MGSLHILLIQLRKVTFLNSATSHIYFDSLRLIDEAYALTSFEDLLFKFMIHANYSAQEVS